MNARSEFDMMFQHQGKIKLQFVYFVIYLSLDSVQYIYIRSSQTATTPQYQSDLKYFTIPIAQKIKKHRASRTITSHYHLLLLLLPIHYLQASSPLTTKYKSCSVGSNLQIPKFKLYSQFFQKTNFKLLTEDIQNFDELSKKPDILKYCYYKHIYVLLIKSISI